MKKILKNVCAFALLIAVWVSSFASAAASKTFSKTDCYWKNDSYMCTTKICKTNKPKSCTYKTAKTNPPIYTQTKEVIPELKLNKMFFGIKSCDQYIELTSCLVDLFPKSKKTEYIKMFNTVILSISEYTGSWLKYVCDEIKNQLIKDWSEDIKNLWCGSGYLYNIIPE